MKPTLLTIALLVLSMVALDLYQSCPSPVVARSDEAEVIKPPIYPPVYPYISVKRTRLRNGDEIWIFASHRYAAAIRTGPESIRRVACWYALPDSPYRDTEICPGEFKTPSGIHPGATFLLDGKPEDPLAGVAVKGEAAELRGRRGKEAGVSRIAFTFDTSPPRK